MRAAALMISIAGALNAAELCIQCHAKEAAALARSGMGQSFRNVSAVMPSGGAFRHRPSDSTVQIRGSTHVIQRGGQTTEEDVRYAVGSGKVGISFLVRRGEWLYQSPASYFSARKSWGPSPGYATDSQLDFSRTIPDECVFCHAGSSQWVAGSINRFGTPAGSLEGIPCERCHGGTPEHLRQPSRGNIVNPARLGSAARDSVCEQCHLAGVTRVLNPGRRWQDFTPGEHLERTWSVYVPARQDADAGLTVVSHVEQLAASACAQESRGRLWCGSCHSVHNANTDYSATCRSCHPVAHKQDRTRQDRCIDCHMPKRATMDGGHTVFTDHRIQKRPSSIRRAADSAPRKLRVWRAGANELRNEGLAYIQAGDHLSSEELMQHGFRLLAAREKDFAADADVLAALGYVLFQKNRPREAAVLLERAVRLRPDNVRFRFNLALALAGGGQAELARAKFEELRRIDPSIEVPDRILNQVTAPAKTSKSRLH